MMSCEIPFLQSSSFLIGHSVELYLKAIRIKQTNDINKVLSARHKVRELFELCQAGKPSFMPSFSFKGTFEELYAIQNKVSREITLTNSEEKKLADILTEGEREKYIHYIQHQEFYLVSENLMNLKYFHSPWIGTPFWEKKGKNIARMRPNPFWINFVKDAENYLGHDLKQIKERLERYDSGLSINTRLWLSDLYK